MSGSLMPKAPLVFFFLPATPAAAAAERWLIPGEPPGCVQPRLCGLLAGWVVSLFLPPLSPSGGQQGSGEIRKKEKRKKRNAEFMVRRRRRRPAGTNSLLAFVRKWPRPSALMPGRPFKCRELACERDAAEEAPPPTRLSTRIHRVHVNTTHA